jgi:O-antigen/teichoic acid export membrane protein
MGAERYGIVVITAATLGSLLIVDAGAGRAVMRAVPWHRARGDDTHAQRLAGSGLLFSLLAGAVIGGAVWLLADEISEILRLTPGTRAIAADAFRVVAFVVPMTLAMMTVAAVAKAAGMFPLTAMTSAFVVVGLNVIWAAVAGQPDDVVLVAKAQLLLTAVALGVLVLAVRLRARDFLFPLRPSLEGMRELVSFGGRSAIGMASLGVMNQADKLMLGVVLPVAVLPTYSIPFAVALRITVVSNSLATALLPRLAAVSSLGDLDETRRIGFSAYRVVGLASATVAATCVFGGGAFLDLWVGEEFAADAWGPLIALSIGFAALAIGLVGQTMLDAAGRPGLNAALTATGSALGLGLALGLAAIFETALAAAIGIAAGLCVIGISAVEYSRRLVLEVSRASVFEAVGAPCLRLTAAAAIAFGLSELAQVSPAVTLAAVGAAALVAAGRGALRQGALGRLSPVPGVPTVRDP